MRRAQGYDSAVRVHLREMLPSAPAKNLPVIREQAVAEDEPPPLVTLQIVGPFKKPAFVSVRPRCRGRGRGGRRALPLLAHPPLRRTPKGAGETRVEAGGGRRRGLYPETGTDGARDAGTDDRARRRWGAGLGREKPPRTPFT